MYKCIIVHAGGAIISTYFVINLTLDSGTYLLKLKAYNGPNDRVTVSRKFTITKNILDCAPYLVEGGIEVDGDTATLIFGSTGVYDAITCQLDRKPAEICKY